MLSRDRLRKSFRPTRRKPYSATPLRSIAYPHGVCHGLELKLRDALLLRKLCSNATLFSSLPFRPRHKRCARIWYDDMPLSHPLLDQEVNLPLGLDTGTHLRIPGSVCEASRCKTHPLDGLSPGKLSTDTSQHFWVQQPELSEVR